MTQDETKAPYYTKYILIGLINSYVSMFYYAMHNI